jgi:hypothetical protein
VSRFAPRALTNYLFGWGVHSLARASLATKGIFRPRWGEARNIFSNDSGRILLKMNQNIYPWGANVFCHYNKRFRFMLISFRNTELTYTMDIKDDKTNIVLDWLLEFRFSSIDLLARRLDSNAANSNRFFNTMIANGLIQKFKNVHTRNDNYVMLTTIGMSYLEGMGRDISVGTTRIANLGKYSQIIHDIAVQEAALKRLHQFEEVIWDRNIQLEETFDKPDLMFKSSTAKVALEYERWRKDTKRIFISFYNHATALTNKQYNGVYYVFDKEVDYLFYQKLFNQNEWPRYKRQKKTGKINALGSTYEPDKVTNLRKCFVFLHEPIA